MRLIAAFAVLLAALSARAGEASPSSPCNADIARVCGKVQPGGGRIGTCLVENKDALSESCRDWVTQRGEKAVSEGKVKGDAKKKPAKKPAKKKAAAPAGEATTP
jgi:hypothetical protein